MAAAGPLWAPVALRLLRAAASRTAEAARQKVAAAVRPLAALPGAARVASRAATTSTTASRTANTISSKTLADLRRFFSTLAQPQRRLGAEAWSRATTPRAAHARRAAPFASPLRPTFVGAIPRSAGGYAMGAAGAGARCFSHGPVAPAEVIQAVSQAMRAFLLEGKRARYDGVNARGNRRYRAVSATEDEAARRLAAAKEKPTPGAFVDFRLSPTVTATSPLLAAAFPGAKGISGDAPTLHADGFLDLLAGDFERAARDLASILADLRRLAHLGDLPVSMAGPTTLRVRFPGVDAETVERLCADAGLRRGFVGEDVGVDMALRFPYAPDGSGGGGRHDVATTFASHLPSLSLSYSSSDGEGSCGDFFEEAYLDEYAARGWSDPEAASGRPASDDSTSGCATPQTGSLGGEVEGLFCFLEACDRAQGVY